MVVFYEDKLFKESPQKNQLTSNYYHVVKNLLLSKFFLSKIKKVTSLFEIYVFVTEKFTSILIYIQ